MCYLNNIKEVYHTFKFQDLYFCNNSWDPNSMLKIFVPDCAEVIMEAEKANINYGEYAVGWFKGNAVGLEGVIDD